MTANEVPAAEIPGVRVIQLKAHVDARGRFIETYREEWFQGCPRMVQGNRSDSTPGVLRGLHYHLKQADYWYVPAGSVLAVMADLRQKSPTRGKIALVELGDGHDVGLYIPPGVAHGYLARTQATMTYLVDRYYDPQDELGVAWDDPQLAIPWGLDGPPNLSPRDQQNPRVKDLDPTRLPP